MSELQYAIENIIPRIAAGEFTEGEIIFDALELMQDIKPRSPLSKLIEVFTPLADGTRYIHIREESDQPSVVIRPYGDEKVKRIDTPGPVARYIVTWFEVPKKV